MTAQLPGKLWRVVIRYPNGPSVWNAPKSKTYSDESMALAAKRSAEKFNGVARIFVTSCDWSERQ